jgi:hypothetical protein
MGSSQHYLDKFKRKIQYSELKAEANRRMAVKLDFFLALGHVGHEGKNKFPRELP